LKLNEERLNEHSHYTLGDDELDDEENERSDEDEEGNSNSSEVTIRK
jgi:hypothetical protein